ncbi:MAG: ABC transporter permease [Lachnospiraceae bacterium]|jgi:ABC-2 type transport system permease protein|nr:ABC transporter permease [Lachnospiraceae bacterium]
MGNINKLTAVARIKWICISRNTAIMVGPVITVAMVLAYKVIYGMNTDGELSPILAGMLLSLGISMNICMDGFLMVGTAIAEEKEKHTLRVLMTSSITGVQYFIGSILFPFALTVGVNFVVLAVSGVSIGQASIVAFLLLSAAASLISCVIGMVVGICAKNQMNANLIAYPLMLVFMMVPMFGNFSEGLHKLSGFLFTGVLTEMAYGFANGEPYVAKPLDIAVLVGELVISILVFLILYKRNGFEKD